MPSVHLVTSYVNELLAKHKGQLSYDNEDGVPFINWNLSPVILASKSAFEKPKIDPSLVPILKQEKN